MKKEILNCVRFCPRNEWKPLSNDVFFSPYGLWGANTRFTVNNIIAKRGMKNKKKVRLLI
jgi:hypothetical protein